MSRQPKPTAPDLKRAAALLGQRGGSQRSDRKAEAARANGAKGGRPRKDPAPAPKTTTRRVRKRVGA